MLRSAKQATLALLRSSGVFGVVAGSRWRQQRLLILCYHGTSIEDEHLWRPGLYIDPGKLKQRFETLKRGKYSVLQLGEALQHLREGDLPPRSVAITFDDGTYDFYCQAHPLLKQYGFPATVYQTTYYSVVRRPIFNLICSYMLWKKRGDVIRQGEQLGLTGSLNLQTEAGRHRVVRELIAIAERENMSGVEKDNLAARLAEFLGVDYEALRRKRILQLMNREELVEIARNGIDIQLHTHRHRTPEDETLFRREIRDNRGYLQGIAGGKPVHFCYPSGVYREMFFPWLQAEDIQSATTCDPGLATRNSEILLLPRFVDTQGRTDLDFESWISGVGDLLAFRRKAAQKYIPEESDA